MTVAIAEASGFEPDDAEKLRNLARWLDRFDDLIDQPAQPRGVQHDLRRLSILIDQLGAS